MIEYSFLALIFETPSLSSKVFLQVSVLTTYNTEMHFFAFRCFKRERERVLVIVARLNLLRAINHPDGKYSSFLQAVLYVLKNVSEMPTSDFVTKMTPADERN